MARSLSFRPPAAASIRRRSSRPASPRPSSSRSRAASRPASERQGIIVAPAHGDLLDQLAEADVPGLRSSGWLSLFLVSDTPTASIRTKRVLVCGVGRHRSRSERLDDADAAALHLLEVDLGLDVAHEDQDLDRLDVGAGRDHVDGDGDPGQGVDAEALDQLLRALARLVGDLLGEVVALPNTSRAMWTISSAWLSSLAKIRVFGHPRRGRGTAR